MSDLYAVLGASRDATDKEIRNAYRKLAKQFHPDHNSGKPAAEERFKKVTAAYNILGDKEKRGRYDRGEIDEEGNERASYNPYGQGGGFTGSQPFQNAQGRGFRPEDLNSFFSDMFQGGAPGGGFQQRGAGQRARRGADRAYTLTVSFEDSVLGASQRITLPEAGTVDVKIPAGIESGQILRLAGKGGEGLGEGAPKGDALVTVHVTPSATYTRDGRNLKADLFIDLPTAILGGKRVVPTPRGPVTMKIPAHSDTGSKLRLAGRGIAAHGKHAAGDLTVTLQVKIGTIDPALEEFLRQRADRTEEPEPDA